VTNVLWAAAELSLPDLPPDKAHMCRGEEIRDMCSQIAAASAAGGGRARRGEGGGARGYGSFDKGEDRWSEVGSSKVEEEDDAWSVQGAATSLWAMAVLGISARSCVQPLAQQLLELLASRAHLLQDSDYGQLHQYFLASTLALAPPASPSSSIAPAPPWGAGWGMGRLDLQELERKSKQAFANTSARVQTKSEAQLELARQSLSPPSLSLRPSLSLSGSLCTETRKSFAGWGWSGRSILPAAGGSVRRRAAGLAAAPTARRH
jgi:hypothetical protein